MTTQSTAANITKKAMKKAIKSKFNIATLKIKLIIGGVLLALLLIAVIVAGVSSIMSSVVFDPSENKTFFGYGQAQVSPAVEQYRGAISEELSKYGKSQYTDLLLALMMQESGGQGNDPMQASESKCGYIGCITSPDESIKYGVKHFVNVLAKANNDVKLTLQSYNFGGGFIDYVKKNGGAYTYQLAISFSQMMYNKLAHLGIYKCHRPEAIQYNACYGDIGYVEAVLRYLPSAVGVNSEPLDSGFSSPLKVSLRVTSPYGWRVLWGKNEFHTGIDLACSAKDSVHSVLPGSVIYAGQMSTYGNLVEVQHKGIITAYAHLSRIGVKVGDTVEAGQAVGMCGATGRVSGPHLHFETKTEMWGGFMNPSEYLGGI